MYAYRSNPLTPDILEQLLQNAAAADAVADDDENKIENLLAKEFHVRCLYLAFKL